MEGIYVDVREQDEWDMGHLKDAIHCPLSELMKGNIPDNLPADEVLYIYCAHGNRSQIAKKILLPTHPLAQSLSKGYEDLLYEKKATLERIAKLKEEKREKKKRYAKGGDWEWKK